MSKITKFMVKDHDKIDELFRSFRRTKIVGPAKAKLSFAKFRAALLKHIVWEEIRLFPLLRKYVGTTAYKPIDALRADHAKIKGLLKCIQAGLPVRTGRHDHAELELLWILSAHTIKEESTLYAWIGTSMHKDRKEALLKEAKFAIN